MNKKYNKQNNEEIINSNSKNLGFAALESVSEQDKKYKDVENFRGILITDPQSGAISLGIATTEQHAKDVYNLLVGGNISLMNENEVKKLSLDEAIELAKTLKLSDGTSLMDIYTDD